MNKTTFSNFKRFFIRSLTNTVSSKNLFGKLFLTLLVFVLSANGLPNWQANNNKNLESWTWETIKENQLILPGDDSHWSARAGLQALNHKGKFYIFGGRTPLNIFPGANQIHGDVWSSSDQGASWTKILASNPDFGRPNHWPNRAYFQAVSKGSYMYIIGGQDFSFTGDSNFFNDVWRSKDGINWKNMTEGMDQDNRWAGRAGLSAVVFKGYIYVMAGSENDDCASFPGGECPPNVPAPRKYYNDVWKSKDGKHWTEVTPSADWDPRAGGIAVVKNGYMYMIGGEEGFICDPLPFCDPPYFNDVWRTKDGENWEPVTRNAEWTKRPGHQVIVAQNQFVLFGGFGLLENPQDVWVSKDGKTWNELETGPWNDADSDKIKYDFDAFAVKGYGKFTDAIYTFGGDRETFDFGDPTNYLRVDNDVWKFSLPKKETPPDDLPKKVLTLYPNYPNPFSSSTNLKYTIPKRSFVSLKIYDKHGRFVSKLITKMQDEGSYEVVWNGNTHRGKPVKKGLYYAILSSGGKGKTIKLIKD